MKFLRFLVLAWFLAAPFVLQAQREKFPLDELEVIEKRWPDAKRTVTGLRTQILAEGKGDTPRPGDKVRVLYKGSLLDGQVFDQQADPARAFSFRVGRKEVIPGWDEGLQLMRPGERRLLIVPYELAYGTRGRPPVIPRNATLVFEVELLDVQPLPADQR